LTHVKRAKRGAQPRPCHTSIRNSQLWSQPFPFINRRGLQKRRMETKLTDDVLLFL